MFRNKKIKTNLYMIILFTIIVILIVFFMGLWFTTVENKINKIESELETYIGKECIINKDTLQVIDYSIWSEKLILSNGLQISPKIINNEISNEKRN